MQNIDPEIVRLRRTSGESVERIAASLGVSVRRVYQIVGPEKAKPPLTEEETAEIRARAMRGQSIRQIAANLGKSRKTVAKAIGDAPRPQGVEVTDEEVEMILSSHAAGHTAGTIAKFMDRPPSTIARVIEREATRDWIQEAVIARATELGMDGAAIHTAAKGRVKADLVQAYLRREGGISSLSLQHVLRAIALAVVPREKYKEEKP